MSGESRDKLDGDASRLFVAAARERMDEGLHKSEHCLKQLDDEAV